MSESRIVYLEVSSWVGMSIGASHTYGELYSAGKIVRVTHRLTPRQAAELNKAGNWGFNMYKPGDSYEGFENEEQVIRRALKVWKEYFPCADTLILGRSAVADPQRVLVGPPEFKKQVNTWWRMAVNIGYYDGGHATDMHKISNAFWQYFCDYRSQPGECDE